MIDILVVSDLVSNSFVIGNFLPTTMWLFLMNNDSVNILTYTPHSFIILDIPIFASSLIYCDFKVYRYSEAIIIMKM